MKIAIFDLDNTLLAGDSDFLWGKFLVDHGIVDSDYYAEKNRQFYQDYTQGTLDIHQYLTFALGVLKAHPAEKLHQWRAEFVEEMIKPRTPQASIDLVQSHKKQGHKTLIITATNAFVTQPIGRLFGVDALLATLPETQNGEYTGGYLGKPCFQAGKIDYLHQWLAEQQIQHYESWFYSDSINDLPLLEQVDHPLVVNPDDRLAHIAQQRQWPRLALWEKTNA